MFKDYLQIQDTPIGDATVIILPMMGTPLVEKVGSATPVRNPAGDSRMVIFDHDVGVILSGPANVVIDLTRDSKKRKRKEPKKRVYGTLDNLQVKRLQKNGYKCTEEELREIKTQIARRSFGKKGKNFTEEELKEIKTQTAKRSFDKKGRKFTTLSSRPQVRDEPKNSHKDADCEFYLTLFNMIVLMEHSRAWYDAGECGQLLEALPRCSAH